MSTTTTQPYRDGYWTSSDGLKLHFRDYPAGGDAAASRPPAICLPGLTRNARDFAELAEWMQPDRRVLCIENRGRGDSEYAIDPQTYRPATYVADLLALLEQEGIARFIAVGTSLGGLMTMLLATTRPQVLAGAIINDIGPEIDPAGLSRIASYVGTAPSYASWDEAAEALHAVGDATFPAYTREQWKHMARRSMKRGKDGRISPDYDPRIAEPFREPGNAASADLWPAWAALAKIPLLVLRGELSDLLSTETVVRMKKATPQAEFVTVPDVGHAPMLDEPASRAAIARLLERVQ